MDKNKFSISSDATEDYEPFLNGDEQAGEVHWLTQSNSSGEPTYSGLWRCEPMSFDYIFPGDEYIHVLQGDLLIELANGDSVNLTQGDVAAFDKGVESKWTIRKSFKKFFVISNC